MFRNIMNDSCNKLKSSDSNQQSIVSSLDWPQAWKQQHGKTYPANSDTKAVLGELSEDESFRMNIWAENKATIEKHNKQFKEVEKK